MKEQPGIIFYGTPEFAVASLTALVDAGRKVICVVTAPDREAGRGMKLSGSPVKQYALEQGLPLLQPLDLKDPLFLDAIRLLQPDLQVVVAFRLLPKEVWSLPPLGTFNLHGSLLPDYRGAAPINRVIMNGETRTGVTTFFIDDKIDTGNIIAFRETAVGPAETAGELHDRLMMLGAELVVETVESIAEKKINPVVQVDLIAPQMTLKKAPKILKEDCSIDWEQKAEVIFNHIRGLSPVPGAFTILKASDGSSHYLKVFRASPEIIQHSLPPGKIMTDGSSYLKIAAIDGFVQMTLVQQSGKKPMNIADFLRGFNRQFT